MVIGDTPTDWCQQNKELYNVEVGKSWGTLPETLQEKWSVLRCDHFFRDDSPPNTYLLLFCLSLFFTLIKVYQDTTNSSKSNNPIKKNV